MKKSVTVKARNYRRFMFAGLFLMLTIGCSKNSGEKINRVGILIGAEFLMPAVDGFKEKMNENDYVEGKNIEYDIKNTNYEPEAEKAILKKWVAEKYDLIVTSPTEVTIAAKDATWGSKIPVVFTFAFTEGNDLVDSIRNPGGNLTGVRYSGADLAVKSLEILLEISPDSKRIWLPYLEEYPSVPEQLSELRKAAALLNVRLIEFPAAHSYEIAAELKARNKLSDTGIDAIMHLADPFAVSHDVISAVSEFVTEHRLAYHGTGGKCVFILSNDPVEVGRQAAFLADKVLKGIPVETIPVVSADPVLTINYGVAKQLGLTVPESLLARADHIAH